jgi:hypothetical protein
MSVSRLAFAAMLVLQGCRGSADCHPSAASPSTQTTAGSAPSLQPVQVPSALAALTSNPELSGIAWSSALQRYIVVSDDTGKSSDGTAHRPWVFALSQDGALDRDPIPIVGLPRLNDAEAICAGPGGTFFITTSHSSNTHGNLPSARRLLMQVDLKGSELRMLGSVDLTEATATDGAGLLALAGLDPAGALDIEALAFRDPDLYIGLKSPLTHNGEATVLKMVDPSVVLRTGRLPPGAVTQWRRVQMCRPGPSGRVCEGISDMTFLPDGSLVLLGNTPKGRPSDGGGALWLLANPSVSALPQLIRHFENLKPEGVAVSSDRGAVVIVFDRDRQQPVWMRWPIPF